MKLLSLLIIFLVINFGGLALGNWFMGNGPQTQWYLSLNKAPWTPPGWVFGVAWFSIMVCFSIYMAYLYKLIPEYQVILLFGIQFMLNVSWNYVFFNKQYIALGFIVILLLTLVIALLLYLYAKPLKSINLLILPYLLWLIIASTLNGYILFNN
ncbi:tryptophan-rich sensory protein [Seonamhaeicola sediminis]|uniref:Tryptophan-rich sensory protein n=1 Tax=Seonamhaeicola sediminis TaxID=2528206 RepID=A0A562YC66_9FLAO|nr:TspO/MBR family protein [Seonamhaeicola sediminis]TWO31685.1 tryptophan-rich sensory protein [Seonamhaeicola sediminis]